ATPPNGVTARCVSRKINRSSDNREVISRGTGLSVAFVSIRLLSQTLGRNPTSNVVFSDKISTLWTSDVVTRLSLARAQHHELRRKGCQTPRLLNSVQKCVHE